MPNTFKVAGSLVWLQPGALEASGNKLGDTDKGQAPSVPGLGQQLSAPPPSA